MNVSVSEREREVSLPPPLPQTLSHVCFPLLPFVIAVIVITTIQLQFPTMYPVHVHVSRVVVLPCLSLSHRLHCSIAQSVYITHQQLNPYICTIK